MRRSPRLGAGQARALRRTDCACSAWRCATSAPTRARGAPRPGPDRRPRPQRRRQVEPAGGDLLRLHRPLAAHPQRARAVRFGAAGDARRRARSTDDGREHELSVGYSAPAPGQPAVEADELRRRAGRAAARRSPVRPLISVFLPDRLELHQGPAGVRRAHLDQFVAALWPARAETRREYSRVLAQRNALLARIRAGAQPRGGARHLGPRARRGGHRARRPTAPRRSRCSPEPFPERAGAARA